VNSGVQKFIFLPFILNKEIFNLGEGIKFVLYVLNISFLNSGSRIFLQNSI